MCASSSALTAPSSSRPPSALSASPQAHPVPPVPNAQPAQPAHLEHTAHPSPPPLLHLRGPCALLSDLHLNGGPRDPLILEALRAAAQGALGAPLRHLLLVGDVFDFNLGYKSVLYAHLLPAYRLIAELVEAGVEVVIFTGNHDPDPCPTLASLGARVLTGPAAAVAADGQVAWIEHGDALEPHPLKRLACRLARSPLITATARLLPPALALALAPRLPQAPPPPRSLDALRAERSAPIEALPDPWLARQWRPRALALEAALAREGLPPLAERTPPVWCFGHFHAARDRALPLPSGEPHAPRLLALGDWVERWTLAWWAEAPPHLLRWELGRWELGERSHSSPSSPSSPRAQII